MRSWHPLLRAFQYEPCSQIQSPWTHSARQLTNHVSSEQSRPGFHMGRLRSALIRSMRGPRSSRNQFFSAISLLSLSVCCAADSQFSIVLERHRLTGYASALLAELLTFHVQRKSLANVHVGGAVSLLQSCAITWVQPQPSSGMLSDILLPELSGSVELIRHGGELFRS